MSKIGPADSVLLIPWLARFWMRFTINYSFMMVCLSHVPCGFPAKLQGWVCRKIFRMKVARHARYTTFCVRTCYSMVKFLICLVAQPTHFAWLNQQVETIETRSAGWSSRLSDQRPRFQPCHPYRLWEPSRFVGDMFFSLCSEIQDNRGWISSFKLFYSFHEASGYLVILVSGVDCLGTSTNL